MKTAVTNVGGHLREGLQRPSWVRQREETKVALAACQPLLDFSLLSPFLTPEQFHELYSNYTTASMPEVLELTRRNMASQSLLHLDTASSSSLLEFEEAELDSEVFDKSKFSTLCLVSQNSGEEMQLERIRGEREFSSDSDDSQGEELEPVTFKRAAWQKLRRWFCRGSLLESRSVKWKRKRRTKRSTRLLAAVKAAPPQIVSGSSVGWIPSGQDNTTIECPPELSPHSRCSQQGNMCVITPDDSPSSSYSNHLVGFHSKQEHSQADFAMMDRLRPIQWFRS